MRVAGRAIGFLLLRGVRLGPMMLLTVRGRRTGQPRTNPVDLFERDDRRWLVSTHGAGDSNWVRNLRAAGEGTLARGKHRLSFTAVELEPGDAARVSARGLGAPPGASAGRIRFATNAPPRRQRVRRRVRTGRAGASRLRADRMCVTC